MKDEVVKKWRKIGGGVFLLNGNRWIKPNQEFYAKESEIPLAFRDTVLCLSETEKGAFLEGTEEKSEVSSSSPGMEEFRVVRRNKSRWFDVVNSAGKVMNDKPLEKEEAIKLVKVLEGKE